MSNQRIEKAMAGNNSSENKEEEENNQITEKSIQSRVYGQRMERSYE